MGLLDEGAESAGQFAGLLNDAKDQLSGNYELTFQCYSRAVLPYDKYVYWQPTVKTQPIAGSLHFTQDIEQNEDETVGLAHVVFTARQRITEFAEAPPNTIFVATIGDFRFAFARQMGRYEEAGIWHYEGRSIYPALASLLLDTPGLIDPTRAVVSNSLPLWLDFAAYKPLYGFKPNLTLYPADLVEPNLTPPYGAVLISGPEPLTVMPGLDANSSSTQLVADNVRLVLYGLQSNEAVDFLNAMFQYSLDTDNFGVMKATTVVDGKRPQQELQAIAMQKMIDVRISYTQSRLNTVARKLILSAVPTILLNRVPN